jgi:MiaB/RimO family radical SAM methylthiotransferase
MKRQILNRSYFTFKNHRRVSSTIFRYSSSHLSNKPWLHPNAPTLSHFMNDETVSSSEQHQQHYLEQLYHQLDTKQQRKNVYIETYGCQMNVSDTEIVYSIMNQSGYDQCRDIEEADVILLNTCAIRDHAESKIWGRLGIIRKMRTSGSIHGKKPVVGVLGCMAERLKTKLLEKENMVDIVAGPDSYRDLPRLIHLIDHEEQQHAVNVILSMDETYADIVPIRTTNNNVSAFVTIMRGCDNMCSYCIVPFTRGRERSRPIQSIIDEVKALSNQGYKEITLLGQNVNSYCDIDSEIESEGLGLKEDGTTSLSSEGFKTIYKPKQGGIRFTELVDMISQVDPEMRIRFTSPHPKDFPDDLLLLIRDRPNICKQIHMPAQSGSTEVLNRMRRGYSREAYLELATKIRKTIPGVSISSDFISGFCGETHEQHMDTISLLEQVKYEHAFLFAYSLREKTHAHRNYQDDVPDEVKNQRLNEAIQVYKKHVIGRLCDQIGSTQLVLIDGDSRKSSNDLVGRADNNMKVLIPKTCIPIDHEVHCSVNDEELNELKPGDYVEVKITGVVGQNLIGEPVCKTTLTSYHQRYCQ